MAAPLYVLIPTHGRAPLLERTLRSVAGAARPDGFRGVWVVENGSPSGADEVVRRVAADAPALGVRYLHHEGANKSAALNSALAHVEDDDALLVLLDDDVRVDPGVLTAYAEAARHSPRAYFGGPVSCDYEEAPPDWLRPSLPHSARGYELDDRGVMTDEYLGFNWAAYARDLEAVGGFDSRVGPGSPTGARGQETEMQGRLRAAGVGPVDVPAARVWHYVPKERSSVRWLLRRSKAMGRSVGATESLDQPDKSVILPILRSSLSLAKRAVLLDRAGAVAAARGLASALGRLESRRAGVGPRA